MTRAKRTVKEGYPWTGRFACRQSIDDYLSGDRIVCLLCGHTYRILDTHLRSVHLIDSDEYREKYGIPYMRGLCDAEFSERRTENSKEMFEKNKARQTEALKLAQASIIRNGNPQRNKPDFWKDERTKYGVSDFEEFAARVISGRTVASVEKDEDMPTQTHLRWHLKRDKKFSAYWLRHVKPLLGPARREKSLVSSGGGK